MICRVSHADPLTLEASRLRLRIHGKTSMLLLKRKTTGDNVLQCNAAMQREARVCFAWNFSGTRRTRV